MAWRIEFSSRAEKQLRKLDTPTARRILTYLKQRVEADPKTAGKPLKGNLSAFWRYRVGEYRIICSIEEDRLLVLVLEIGHRRDIYTRK